MNQTQPGAYTAAQVAAAIRVSPQAARKALREVKPAGVRIVGGAEAAAWSLEQLPGNVRERLEAEAAQRGCRDVAEMLAAPAQPWMPPLPLDQIDQGEIDSAQKLREAMRPWLSQQRDSGLSAGEKESRGVADYARAFGHTISTRYWRELFKRTVERDAGGEDWNRLEIYLPAKPKPKVAARRSGGDDNSFPALLALIKECSSPESNDFERRAIWAVAMREYVSLLDCGESPNRAARRVRGFLFVKAPFLAPSRDALLKAFERKRQLVESAGRDLSCLQNDGRGTNGPKVSVPKADLDWLRASAAFANGGRIDAAWRDEYSKLSEETRKRWPYSLEAPRVFHRLLGREKTDALTARHQGKIALRRLLGGVQRDRENMPSMVTWTMDDVTSNIEVTHNDSLLLPQIVVVMDCGSGKIVGWAASTDKGPTAELVCTAFMDAVKTHGVPKELALENGFVFGKSLNINGKEDEEGRTLVAGLALYGCTVRHFEKMNPTGKAELEKAFDLLQARQERHPGYGGRIQMIDAPEEFKREQRLIRADPSRAKEFRYTFAEFFHVFKGLVEEYNAHPQRGALNLASPNEAHEAKKDKSDPPIQFCPALEWWLANARYLVPVSAGGVSFSHYGREIRVKGGPLARFDMIGKQMWAVVDRLDDSLITFMSLDFRETFTMEPCSKPSPSERLIAPGSGVLGAERKKVKQHEKAIEDEYKAAIARYGNPRRDLLVATRNEVNALTNERTTIVPPNLERAGADMATQRAELNAAREERASRTRSNKARAQRLGIPDVLVSDDTESTEALELMAEARREHRQRIDAKARQNAEEAP